MSRYPTRVMHKICSTTDPSGMRDDLFQSKDGPLLIFKCLLPFHMPITITSLNAKGLNSPFKRAMLWKEAKLTKCDILCVQETHFHAQKPPNCQNKSFSHYYFANAPQKRKGVFIAIHNSVPFPPLQVDADVHG